jgi:hypothetical protein
MDKQGLREDEIDELVESQADDDSAWGKPVKVTRQEAAAERECDASRARNSRSAAE